MYLICDVALHEHLFVMKHHMIEKLCNFESSSWSVTTLPSVVAIGIVVIEMCF